MNNTVSLPNQSGETQALWKCSTCGAQFPHTRGDEDVAQCSKCVEVEVLAARVGVLLAERDRLRVVIEKVREARSQILEDEMSRYGGCRYCGATDYPVDVDGNRMPGPDVGDADSWQIDHDTDCPSAILGDLDLGQPPVDTTLREGGE